MSPQFDSHPGPHGIFCNPLGIFIHGENRVRSTESASVWIYLTSTPGGEVRNLDVSAGMSKLSPKDFESLATSELWKSELRPALVEESICFSEWYEKTTGSRLKSRFSRPQMTGT